MTRSSLIQRAIYDPAEETLAVTFTTGRSYLYFAVSAELYAEFAAAESQGQFFNWRVRDQYEFREMDQSPSDAIRAGILTRGVMYAAIEPPPYR